MFSLLSERLNHTTACNTKQAQTNKIRRKNTTRTEVRGGGARDKELASVRVWAAVGHGQESWSVVFMGKVFVGKGGTVDAEFSRAWQADSNHTKCFASIAIVNSW